jgi:hypothetical protein
MARSNQVGFLNTVNFMFLLCFDIEQMHYEAITVGILYSFNTSYTSTPCPIMFISIKSMSYNPGILLAI